MAQLIDVEFRHGVRLNATAAHNLIMSPASQPHSRTLYFQHDMGGTHFTVLTDDAHYDPSQWGHQARTVQVSPYELSVHAGDIREFRIRLDRSWRIDGRVLPQPRESDEELDRLLTRVMTRAGANVLSYDVTFDRSMTMGGSTGAIPTATFRGVMQVHDASLCTTAHMQGLGRSKRFGCGLLLTRLDG